MCFSATASFLTAGVTASLGIAALTRVGAPRELPLAIAPILFAAQQSIEGLLWLNLPLAPDGPVATGLTLLFLIFAEAFWPVYASIAVLCVEPSEARWRLIAPCLAVGAALAAYLLWGILARPHGASIVDGHIVYANEIRHSAAVPVAYLVATSLPLLLSSQRPIVVLGVINLVGCVTAYAFYLAAFVSVWCFFAAAASVVILWHFQWARRYPMQMAGA